MNRPPQQSCACGLRSIPRCRGTLIAAAVCVALSGPICAQQTSPAHPEGVKDSPAARDAYVAGARYLERDQLEAAEQQFQRAATLAPRNQEYGIALQLAREHRVTSLIQQAGRARLAGHADLAQSLIEQARSIDPENPLVLEHLAAQGGLGTQPPQSNSGGALPAGVRLVGAATVSGSRLPQTVIAGAIELQPSSGPAALQVSGDSREVLTQIAKAYGLRAVFDDTVEKKSMRFDMDSATFEQAMPIAEEMAHVFGVPVDAKTILFAKDDPTDRQRLEPLLEETVYLPAMTPEQVNDVATVIRTVFGITKASVETTLGAIVVRAPESVLGPMNATIQQFLDAQSEVMLDVKLYELDSTRSRNIGATLPTQAGIYNVDSEATNLVNNNQSLVQQAIAQGYISPNASNLQIALALLASGLVQSSLLSNTIGFFGNGLTLTGITETGTVGFNLGLNETETRTLDAVQLRVQDRQPATFRSGTRYPIVTSTYTTGISTPASALGNASINGVSVASLLAQYAGGSSQTIPEVQYEDLGLTLKATPQIERSGRIAMALDLKIEALSGTSLDGNPILNSRQFQSSISVGEGQTAMLVSNLNRTETAAVSGIPGLTELPGFQIPLDQNAEKDVAQLVVMITPHVARRNMNPVAGPPMIVHVPNTQTGAEPFPADFPISAPPLPSAAPPRTAPAAPAQVQSGTAPPANPGSLGFPNAFPSAGPP